MAVKFKKGVDASGQRIINLADASSATDAVTLQQMQAFVRGLSWKTAARVKATGNITLSAPGASINGVTMAVNDRFLAASQTTGSENGVYVWNGAAVAATRATDMDASAEFVGAGIYVTEGTVNADTAWVQTVDPFTLGTTTAVFTQFGGGGTTYTADGNGIELSGSVFSLELDASSGLSKSSTGLKIDSSIVVRKYAANCAATTNPQTFTHGLGTDDVEITVWDVAGNEIVYPDITKGSGTVIVDWGSNPTAGQYRVVIQG